MISIYGGRLVLMMLFISMDHVHGGYPDSAQIMLTPRGHP